MLAVALGEVLVHLVAGASADFGARVWFGVLLGTQAGGVVTILLLAAAMSLADGRLTLAELREMFGMDLVVTAANTCLALITAILVVAAPGAVPLLLVLVAIAYAGYRAYVREHERHKKVEFLYQANRSLAESPEVAGAVSGLLEQAREAFRAERAEMVLFGQDGAVPLRTRLGPDGQGENFAPVDAAAASALRDLAANGPVSLPEVPEAIAPLFDGRPPRNAMVAVLDGEDRPIGTLLLADRIGLTRGFGPDDLLLFETLAANASAALQFDRLEQAVGELRELQERLHHQAYHDPLTSLANRALFSQSVGEALEDGDSVAVLFIDLDDFKGVNDTLGHAIGDQLLCAAASRITRRGGRTRPRRPPGRRRVRRARPARLGGGGGRRHRGRRASRGGLRDAVAVAERLLTVHLSVGVASSCHSGPGAAELLRDADVAMYEAKSARQVPLRRVHAARCATRCCAGTRCATSSKRRSSTAS